MAECAIASDSELARQADVTRETLIRWWGGGRISPYAGERVAEALGLSYEDLLAARDGRAQRPSDEIEAMLDRAAEKAVRRVLAELRRERVPDG